MKATSNLNPSLVSRLRENTVSFGGIHYLDVANANVGSRELTILGDIFKSNGSGTESCPILSVDLSNNPLCGLNSRMKGVADHDGFEDFCNAWISLTAKNNCRLRRLNLSRCVLQTRGFSLLSSVLSALSSLQEVILRDCAMNDEGLEKLSEGIRASKSLIVLDISENKIGSTPVALSSLTSFLSLATCKLKHLVLNSCDLGPAGVAEVFVAINSNSNSNIEVLSLAENFCGDSATEPLSTLLRNSSRLKHLDLSENGLSLEGIGVLCKGLSRNRSLFVLSLAWNDLNNDCAQKLAECLSSNTTLKALHLLGTHIDGEGLAHFASRNIDLDLGFALKRERQRERKVLRETEDEGKEAGEGGEGEVGGPAVVGEGGTEAK